MCFELFALFAAGMGLGVASASLVLARRMAGLAGRRTGRGADRTVFGVERVRSVEVMCRRSEDLRLCVPWILDDVERAAREGVVGGRVGAPGYGDELVNLAGMMRACDCVRAVWDSVCAGELADGMAEEAKKMRGEGVRDKCGRELVG